MQLTFLSFLGLVLPGLLVNACDGHNHARRDSYNGHGHGNDNGHGHGNGNGNGNGNGHGHGQPQPTLIPLTPPSRPLEWGDINIIHTTDSHGWLLGHQKPTFPEPNYSATFGDFSSFVTHMKQIADEKGVDLLLVDSGDLHDGTGLTDGFPPGGVDAHDANEFVRQLPYDLMSIGNHELYIYANTLDMYQNFVPHLNGRYMSSNVNITVPGHNGQNVSVPVGSRFVKFETKHGRKITSVGVLYDFTDNDVGTTVQPVEDMVKEKWFLEAIEEEPHLFLLVGHMPVARDNWPFVFNAIRAVHPTTPILILGGHTHIRDCLQLDGRSMSLESGRYMETVGWMSAELDDNKDSKNIKFSRRYLDANRVTYEYHTQTHDGTFDTALGQQITTGLEALGDRFMLSTLFGTAPQDYFLSAAPYPSNQSVLSLYAAQALPVALRTNNTKATNPAVMVYNSGGIRDNLYHGTFTKNDQITVAPFVDSFLYVQNVTLSAAEATLNALNAEGANERRSLSSATGAGLAGMVGQYYDSIHGYKSGQVEAIYRAWMQEMNARSHIDRRAMANLTLGYVTQDACPGIGDDIAHLAIPFFNVPDFIASDPPTNVSSDALIDFVFVDFIQDQFLEVLNGVQSERNFTDADVQPYTDITADRVLGIYAQQMWN